MKTLLQIILVAYILSSCARCMTPKIAQNRVAKAVECYPELVRTDTIQDTVIIEARSISDTTIVTNVIDTIEFVKNNIRVKIRRVFDTLYIDSIICQTDTIEIEVQVPVEINVTKTETLWQKIEMWLIIVGVFIAIIIIYRILNKLGVL